MTAVERLEALKTVDIKEIDRDSLPKYKDLISELDSRKSNKMEVLLNHSDNPYVYEDMGYVVKSVFNTAASLSYIDCTKQDVYKRQRYSNSFSYESCRLLSWRKSDDHEGGF